MNKDTRNLIIAISAAAIWFVVFVTLSFKKYYAFNCGVDLGNIAQSFYNTLNGKFMQMTFGGTDTNICRWGGHVEIILVFLLPFFALFQSPLTLLFLQTFVIGASGIILYLAALNKLKDSTSALLILFVYLFFPFLPAIALSDIHADPFFVLPLFLAWLFHIKNKTNLFWFFIIISMSAKEYMVLPIALFGLYILNTHRLRGIMLIIIATLYYTLGVPSIIHLSTSNPLAFKTQAHALILPASAHISSVGDAVHRIIATTINKSNLASVLILTILFGYPHLKNKRGLLMLFPMLLLLFALNQKELLNSHRHTIIIPALFISLTDSMLLIGSEKKRLNILFSIVLLSAALFLFSGLSVIGTNIREMFVNTEYRNNYHYKYTNHDRIVDSLIQDIPPQKNIAAEDGIRTKLTNREWSFLHPFPANINAADIYIFDFYEALSYTPWRQKADRAGQLMSLRSFEQKCNLDGCIILQNSNTKNSEQPAIFDTLSQETFKDTDLKCIFKEITQLSKTRYKMKTIISKGAQFTKGDALISFVISNYDTLRILHTPTFCLTTLRDLPQGLYREEFIFDAPNDFQMKHAVHTINLYHRDDYLSFFDRSSYLIKSDL